MNASLGEIIPNEPSRKAEELRENGQFGKFCCLHLIVSVDNSPKTPGSPPGKLHPTFSLRRRFFVFRRESKLRLNEKSGQTIG